MESNPAVGGDNMDDDIDAICCLNYNYVGDLFECPEDDCRVSWVCIGP